MDKNVRKIAVVGDPATVLGFRGLGFETWPANPGEAVSYTHLTLPTTPYV